MDYLTVWYNYIYDTKYSQCSDTISDHNLTESEKEVINLGINCHIQKRIDLIDKRVEMKMLYTSLLKLQEDNKIRINRNFKEELRTDSTRLRSKDGSKLLSNEMKKTIKSLKETYNKYINKNTTFIYMKVVQ